MWAEECVFYQIYPLGFCNAPYENDGVLEHRILKVKYWIEHFRYLNIGAIYFSPLFESDTHGYNARDLKKVDVRLGTNEDFKEVCDALHNAGIKVMLDGVFNHVGRGFFAFRDVLENRENSRYKDWFHINFQGNSCYNDGLYYEGWEGNYDLVKLNLWNQEVVEYLFDSIRFWVDEFGIDGLRLDVAYCLDRGFINRLRSFTNELKPEFYLIGEMIHGNYNDLVRDDMLHSATNYECYKGLYSSFNSMNMFELMHSLMRQFGEDGQGIYRGKHLLSFVDNHDVTRIASILQNEKHLPLLYGALMGMPGIPCIYYGSEWGAKGEKSQGDPALRPSFDTYVENDLTDWVSKLSAIRKQEAVLNYGSFRSAFLTNKQCVMKRELDGSIIYIAINAEDCEFKAYFNIGNVELEDLITHDMQKTDGSLTMPPYSAQFLKVV
ncbi:MAG: cyclomaltodextrinase [Lachnospiraceae bacterium]|nr:cyclomaltodextrinase [Lachnospiraceae bacterium]